MKVEEPDLRGTYNYADYLGWRLPEMVELIKGKVFKLSPAPNSLHQRVSMELLRQIANFLKGKRCQVFTAPFDVWLPESACQNKDHEITTVVQPDICVVCDAEKIDEQGCLGAPDWVIEILSRNTSGKDLRNKFDVYEKSGVKEYWVIHPTGQTVLVFILENGKYASVNKPYITEDIPPSRCQDWQSC
jgi:Uma2 family endonuclease